MNIYGVPSPQELALVKSQPHETHLYLSIYKPPVVWQAQVNGSFSKGDRIITYDNQSFGSYQVVRQNSTLRVGTTPGADDVGTVYIRSISATTITVGSNSHIQWADNLYLTAIEFEQIWPLYPRNVLSGTTVTVYKNFDVAYNGNYNNDAGMGAMISMGSHYAGFLENGSASVFFSATGTASVAGNALTYDWLFEGGTPTGSSSLTPGLVTWNQAGHYTVRLRVSNTNGQGITQFSLRHVSLYDRPGSGPNIPYLEWGITALGGDRGSGGYKARVWVRQDLSAVNKDITEGALVVLFSDEYRGGTKQEIGGTSDGRDSIVFVGYILNGSITYNYEDSKVEFEIGSPSEVAKQCEAFSVSVNSAVDPMNPRRSEDTGLSPWFRMQNMTTKKAVLHYFLWHSTYNTCNDMLWTATDRNLRDFNADRTSLWDAINTLMVGGLNAEMCCDMQGRLWFEDGMRLPNGNGITSSIVSLTSEDWMGDPIIEEHITPEVSYLEMGGTAYAGPANDVGTNTASTALIACAPGETPGYRGRQQRQEGLILLDQSQLNTLVGNNYAYLNARYPNLQLRLVGNYRILDIAPLKQIYVYLPSSQNNRGIDWAGKSFAVESMSWEYDPSNYTFIPSIGMHEIVEGNSGDSIIIPVEPPADVPPTVNPPTINPPSIPPIPPIVGAGFPTCCVGYGRVTFGPISEETVHSPVIGTWYLYGQSSFFPTGHNPQATTLADPAGNTASTFLPFTNIYWTQNNGAGDQNYSAFYLPHGGVWRISGNIILAKDNCTTPGAVIGDIQIAVVTFTGVRPSDTELNQNIFSQMSFSAASGEIVKSTFSLDWDGGPFCLGIKHNLGGTIYECGNSKVYVDFVHAISAY